MQEIRKKKREAGLNLARVGPSDSSLVSRMRKQHDARQGPTCSQTCVLHKLGFRRGWKRKAAKRQGPTCSQTDVLPSLCFRSSRQRKLSGRQGQTSLHTCGFQTDSRLLASGDPGRAKTPGRVRLARKHILSRVLASANMCPPQTWLQELLAEQSRKEAGSDLLLASASMCPPQTRLQELLAEQSRQEAGSDLLQTYVLQSLCFRRSWQRKLSGRQGQTLLHTCGFQTDSRLLVSGAHGERSKASGRVKLGGCTHVASRLLVSGARSRKARGARGRIRLGLT